MARSVLLVVSLAGLALALALIWPLLFASRATTFGVAAVSLTQATTREDRVLRVVQLANANTVRELAIVAAGEALPSNPKVRWAALLSPRVHSAIRRGTWSDEDVQYLADVVAKRVELDLGDEPPPGSPSPYWLQRSSLTMLAGQVLATGDLSPDQSETLSEAILSLAQSASPDDQSDFISAVTRNALWARTGWLQVLRDLGTRTSDEIVRQRVNEQVERLRRRRLID